jgi:hypothetical protein
MRIFVGFGYNARDAWIETHVFPILRCAGFSIVHGKDIHGEELKDEVKRRLELSDAAIGFFTVREGQGDADFTSHIWVRDEMIYAQAKSKPLLLVREEGVKIPAALLGNPQYINLNQDDRLACVAELMVALGRRNIRRVRLDPVADDLRASLWGWKAKEAFAIRYRTQDAEGIESPYRNGRLELVDQGFYLNVSDVPPKGLVEVEGLLNGEPRFGSGWVSADAVQVAVRPF